MKKLSNEKGMALVITLILSLVSLGLLVALFYMVSSGTNISGVNLRYSTALEAAKGISEYVMDNLTKMDYTSVPDNNTCLNLGQYSNLSGYNVHATILSKKDLGSKYLYAVRVTADRTSTKEKATIEFIYKVGN